jgi:CheY-like chemotaxis protein
VSTPNRLVPTSVLLDLNLPRLSGREVLAQVKADPDLRRIPVVVLTTSEAEEDIVRSSTPTPTSASRWISTSSRMSFG